MTTLFSGARQLLRYRSLAIVLCGVLLAFCVGTADSKGQSETPDPKTPIVAVDVKLQLIGSLASSHVYTTYGYIGVVEDNVRREVYTSQRVDDLMQEVGVLTDSLVLQMGGLLKTDLTAEDAKAVREIIEIYGQLKQEAASLRTFAKDKTSANEQAFLRLRSEGWTRVAKLLDIPVEAPVKK